MTRLLLMAGVAGLAISAPAGAERPDRETRLAMIQEAQDDRAAQRKARQEARQQQAAERRQQRAQQNQQARQDRRQQAQESRQQQRAQQRQQAQQERQQRRAQQAQQARQERQQQRAQQAEQARQERQQRRANQAQQAREERQQRRAQQAQQAREERAQRRQQQAQEQRQQRRSQQAQEAREQRRLQRQQQAQESRQQRRLERQERVQDARQDRRLQRQQQVQDNRARRQAERFERQNQRRELREARRVQNLEIARNRLETQQAAQLTQQELQARRNWYRELDRREMRQMRRLQRQYNYANVGQRIVPQRYSTYIPTYYRDRYYDTPQYYYRYDDDYGYLYRINRGSNIVAALIPIFGGYNVGTPWPSPYRSSYVPIGYRPYYYDTPDYYYRYDGRGIYRINAETQLISALVALVTGQPLAIGSPLPSRYGIYNVPLHYRSSYYDTNDAWYRYGDGFIYRVDPYSRNISARYPIYSDSYYVGSPWPVAYPDYNVPYGYREAYYDTPEYHYRYANNGIYRVDPTTQVIQALVTLLTGNQFAIGQRMPAGYGVYNVPFDYRDDYYDTDDEYYRYADGYVYQIDADSGLIEDAYPIYG